MHADPPPAVELSEAVPQAARGEDGRGEDGGRLEDAMAAELAQEVMEGVTAVSRDDDIGGRPATRADEPMDVGGDGARTVRSARKMRSEASVLPAVVRVCSTEMSAVTATTGGGSLWYRHA